MKSNKKGMTLVECIIAMCILGILAAMFVSIAVEAKKKNLNTYNRSNDMYEQAAAAESFNTENKDYSADIKVSKMLVNGSTTSNKFDISVDFTSIKFESDAYGYIAKRTDKDKDKSDKKYQLRFFKSQWSDIVVPPDPAQGRYIVNIYNHSGLDKEFYYAALPAEGGGRFFKPTDGNAFDSYQIDGMFPDKGVFQFGIKVGKSSVVFNLSENPGYGTSEHDATGDKTVSLTDFKKYCEMKDGKATGFVYIHYCSDGKYYSQEEYESLSSKTTE